MSLSIIFIAVILSSAAVGYIVGVDVGLTRAKHAAIETYREMHGQTIKTRAVNGPVGYQVHRKIDEKV